MTLKHTHRLFLFIIIILIANVLAACSAVTVAPTPTAMATSTMVATIIAVPSATNTLIPEPSPTLTLLPTVSFSTEVISSENIDQIRRLVDKDFAGKPEDFFAQSLRFTPDGYTVAATNMTKTYVWDALTGQSTAIFDEANYLRNLAISPDGKMAASFDDDGAVKLWDVQAGKELYTLAHDVAWDLVWSLAFSPDNMILASVDFDGKVTFWDTHTGRELTYRDDPNGPSFFISIAFSPDGSILAVGTQSRITLWDLVSKQLIRTLDFDIEQDEFAGIQRVFFSPDGRLIAATHTKNLVMVWDVSSGKKLSIIVGGSVFVRKHSEGALAFSPDSKIIATGNDDAGSIILWDVLANKELGTVGSEKCIPLDLIFLSKGNVLEIGCNNGTIQFWGLP
jgi:WD40 repeat protein